MSVFFKSIRWRLLAWYGVVLLVVLVAFGCTAFWLARDNRLRRVDRQLDERLSILMEALRPGSVREGGGGPGPGAFRSGGRGGPRWMAGGADFERAPPIPPRELRLDPVQSAFFNSQGDGAFYYVTWLPTGQRFQQSATAPEVVPTPEPYRPMTVRGVRTRGEYREVTLANRRGMRLLVGRSITMDLAELRRLAWLLALAGTGVWLLGMGGGWWIATGAIAPIAHISSTAQTIAAGRLSERINVGDTDSELGQLAKVLNATFDRLQAAFDRQAQFTADASHELRTPVAVILSQTQTALSRDRAAAEYREALEACERTGQRMRGVIESLLMLARLDSRERRLPRERCSLDRITREAVQMLEPAAAEHGVKVGVELEPVECVGDGALLGQLVTNLVTNAIVYNRRGGEVRVVLTALDHSIFLRVQDTGLGLAPEHRVQVFERFFRADKARSRAQGRTGLGLAIAKSIVEAHGGTIDLTSEMGVGTELVVRLPEFQPELPGLTDGQEQRQREAEGSDNEQRRRDEA